MRGFFRCFAVSLGMPVWRLLSQGDGADTAVGVYGHMSGAPCWVEPVTPEWGRRLAMGAEIESLADSLFERGSRFIAR